MRRLTLGDLDLAFENLFSRRKADVECSAAGKLYGPMLAKKHVSMRGLPEAMRGKKPLVEELGAADVTHDDLGHSIHGYLEAVIRSPIVAEPTRMAAQRIRDAFIPEKGALTDSYAEEAAVAQKSRPKLAEREEDLKLFPVPEEKTLYDWVTSFLDAGDALAKLLDQRSLVPVSPAGSVGKLRGETIGLLYQFRATLRTEIADDASLPRDLEAKVFSYFDELNDRRRARPKVKGEEAAAGGSEQG